MKATFRKHVIVTSEADRKEILIVHLSGEIDVQSVDLFRSLNDLTKTAGSDVRFCDVRNDFRQILSATPLGRRPCFDNEISGVESYRTQPSTLSMMKAEPAVQLSPDQDGDLSAEG